MILMIHNPLPLLLLPTHTHHAPRAAHHAPCDSTLPYACAGPQVTSKGVAPDEVAPVSDAFQQSQQAEEKEFAVADAPGEAGASFSHAHVFRSTYGFDLREGKYAAFYWLGTNDKTDEIKARV